MRFPCRLFACLFLCAFACSAWATRINILDPSNSNDITTIRTTPFTVGFSEEVCQDLLPGANPPQMGCFAFVNRTPSSWVGLELTLASSNPNAFSFTCNDNPPGQEAFGMTSCGYDATKQEYDLVFTGGTISNTGSNFFTITEDDLPPGSLEFTATPILASTPEPSAFTLLGTGVLCAGALMWSRRRADA